ncbi:hypothetical protein B4U79_04813, partial [Dinothrombium tinctorium]
VYTILDVIFIQKVSLNILLHGYDSWGNICGQQNAFVERATNSGKDMSKKPFVLVTFSGNQTLQTHCVAECPATEYMLFWKFYKKELNKLAFDDPRRVNSAKQSDQWFVASLVSTSVTVSKKCE